MPLMRGKSERAFKKNVETEMHEGKSQPQSLAIAYSVKRKASRKKMAKGGDVLTTNAREHIKAKNFALPDRRYPIEDETHARNALARVSQHGSPEEKAEVRRKVHAKYPKMGKAQGGQIDPSSEVSVRPDTGYGKIIILKAEGGEVEESDMHKEHDSEDMEKRRQEDRRMERRERSRESMSDKDYHMMAEGGDISASNEKRPMPDNRYSDRDEVARNAAKKALEESDWTDNPTMKQARNKPKVEPIKHPKMVPSSAFSTRLYDKEGNLQESAKPGPYGEKPEKDMDEMGADRQGPAVPDMEDEHSTHRKPYAKGGKINNLVPMEASEEDHAEHPARLEEDDDQMRPPMEDYMSGKEKQLAEGGEIEEGMEPAAKHFDMTADEEMQPMDEEEEEHHSSIADAIMARRKPAMRLKSGSEDEDMAMEDEDSHMPPRSYADGGEVDLDENSMEQPNKYYHKNEDEALKENYDEPLHHMEQPMDSNEHGDEEEKDAENKHDMIDRIRMKMRAKRRI